MKVCRLKPPLSSAAGTPGASISSPMTRLARSWRLVPSSQALTSSGRAGLDLCVVEGLPLVEEEALADGRADQHAGGRTVGTG